MNKNTKIITIVAAVIALIAIVGIVVAMNMNNQDEAANTQTNQATNTTDPSKEFNPQSLDSLSYVSTSTTTVAGQTVESKTESDGKGVLKTSSSYGGTTTESYITGDTVITCVNNECSKTTVDANTEAAEDFAKEASSYKDTAEYIGTEPCGGDTCQVWKANGPAGEITYAIDSENRIAKITLAGTGAETVYEYKAVTIVVPAV